MYINFFHYTGIHNCEENNSPSYVSLQKVPPAKTKSVKSDTEKLSWNLYVRLKSVWSKAKMEKYGDVLTFSKQ